MLERIACTICTREIVIHAGATHDGICRICYKLSSEEREQKARFFRALASGKVYVPSDADMARVCEPSEWHQHDRWAIDANWFSEGYEALEPLLAHAANGPEGYVSCKSEKGATLLIASNEEYAVCAYQKPLVPTQYFAYTQFNLRTQVDPEHHLCSTCPCCGIVQGGYFPSRFHMPKREGFQIASRILLGSDCPIDVSWIPADDCLWMDAGVG